MWPEYVWILRLLKTHAGATPNQATELGSAYWGAR